MQRSTPHIVEALEGKRVTQIACGRDYVIALGLTLPQKDLVSKSKDRLKSSQKARDGSGSRGRAMNTISNNFRLDHDTGNSLNDRSSIQKSAQRPTTKNS